MAQGLRLPQSADYQKALKIVKQKLLTKRAFQQVAYGCFYQVRSGNIAVSSTVPGSITIAGDSDFMANRLFISIDNEFNDATSTILMRMIDTGSSRIITRSPIDLRTIANPGIFDAAANLAVAHYTSGIEFKYLFPRSGNISFEFQNTDAALVHGVTVIFQGTAIEYWE